MYVDQPVCWSVFVLIGLFMCLLVGQFVGQPGWWSVLVLVSLFVDQSLCLSVSLPDLCVGQSVYMLLVISIGWFLLHSVSSAV